MKIEWRKSGKELVWKGREVENERCPHTFLESGHVMSEESELDDVDNVPTRVKVCDPSDLAQSQRIEDRADVPTGIREDVSKYGIVAHVDSVTVVEAMEDVIREDEEERENGDSSGVHVTVHLAEVEGLQDAQET
jgi:hypothetical protein